ncbi:hypothetical protein BST61_g5505 [Cercospora zeina]
MRSIFDVDLLLQPHFMQKLDLPPDFSILSSLRSIFSCITHERAAARDNARLLVMRALSDSMDDVRSGVTSKYVAELPKQLMTALDPFLLRLTTIAESMNGDARYSPDQAWSLRLRNSLEEFLTRAISLKVALVTSPGMDHSFLWSKHGLPVEQESMAPKFDSSTRYVALTLFPGLRWLPPGLLTTLGSIESLFSIYFALDYGQALAMQPTYSETITLQGYTRAALLALVRRIEMLQTMTTQATKDPNKKEPPQKRRRQATETTTAVGPDGFPDTIAQTLTPYVEILVDLSKTLNPHRKSLTLAPWRDMFTKDLQEIVAQAITLKLSTYTAADPTRRYEFFWPASGEIFDSEVHQSQETKCKRQIAISLGPGLRWFSTGSNFEGGSEERPNDGNDESGPRSTHESPESSALSSPPLSPLSSPPSSPL